MFDFCVVLLNLQNCKASRLLLQKILQKKDQSVRKEICVVRENQKKVTYNCIPDGDGGVLGNIIFRKQSACRPSPETDVSHPIKVDRFAESER